MSGNNIKNICIDLDYYGKNYTKFLDAVRFYETRVREFGRITSSKKTRKGWHIKCQLNRKVNFWRSIEIRYYCGDDLKRMFYDIMRYRTGGRMLDTCFDHKVYLKRVIDSDHG